jgi:peroxiredoxin family protein
MDVIVDDGPVSFITPHILDAESAEVIEHLINGEEVQMYLKNTGVNKILNEPLKHSRKDVLMKYDVWIRDILKWFKISKEMEAVRASLKKTLDSIDYYRQMQEVYHVDIMPG